MLPKCVLPSCKHRGRHNRPISIKFLCDLWAKDDFVTLWNLAKGRSRSLANYSVSRDEASSHHTIDSAVSLARDGLIRKASRVLLSDGIAPNNDQTWKLLQSKHPSCPLPLAPKVISEPLSLGRNFDILSVLKSFPKDTAAGPSGLRVQHLLDAASIPLATSICSSLKSIVNLIHVASGKAPNDIAKFLVGEALTALNKIARLYP